MSISIEGISLEHFSASHHSSPFLVSDHVSNHAVFYYYFSDDRKQDASTTSTHSNRIVELFQNRIRLFAAMSNIWENMYGCME